MYQGILCLKLKIIDIEVYKLLLFPVVTGSQAI